MINAMTYIVKSDNEPAMTSLIESWDGNSRIIMQSSPLGQVEESDGIVERVNELMNGCRSSGCSRFRTESFVASRALIGCMGVEAILQCCIVA